MNTFLLTVRIDYTGCVRDPRSHLISETPTAVISHEIPEAYSSPASVSFAERASLYSVS